MTEVGHEVELADLRAVLKAIEDAAFRGKLAALHDALDAGALGPGEQAALEHLLELGLQPQRVIDVTSRLRVETSRPWQSPTRDPADEQPE